MAMVFYPPVPIKGFLSGPFKVGSRVEISGTVNNNADDFAVNLKAADGRTILHINPRYGSNVVVLNSNLDSWGNEERQGYIPFQAGAPFFLNIKCESNGFQVEVNGTLFHFFNHRANPEDVIELGIKGDVSIQKIQEIPVPYKIPLATPVRARVGKHLFINGTLLGQGFTINLRGGGNTLLHYNPRILESCVVRNTNYGGNWGPEERTGDFPFAIGQPFQVHIIIDTDRFRVFVDGKLHSEFMHRFAPEVDFVDVDGEVELDLCHA